MDREHSIIKWLDKTLKDNRGNPVATVVGKYLDHEVGQYYSKEIPEDSCVENKEAKE